MKPEATAPFIRGHGSVQLTTKRGRYVTIRHMARSDDQLLIAMYHQLSPETLRLRFFKTPHELPEEIVRREAQRLATIDPLTQAALIATVVEDGREQAVGVARLGRSQHNPLVAEPAIVLRDDYQGEGLGAQLFDLLIQLAQANGIRQLRATMLPENQAIQRLIRHTGMPTDWQVSSGELIAIITIRE